MALATCSPAHADAMGLPGTRRVKPKHQVAAHEPFPNHVFILYDPDGGQVRDEKSGRMVSPARWAEFVTIEPKHPLMIEFLDSASPQRRFGWSAALLVVPRANAPTGSALDVANAALAGHIADTSRYTFWCRDSAPAWVGNEMTIRYQIRRVEGSDRLEIARTSWDEEFVCCCVAPLLASLGTFLGGLRVLYRWLRPKPKSAVSNTNERPPDSGNN